MNYLRRAMQTSFFKLESNFKLDYAPCSVKKWRSSRTGLELTLISQKSPIVNGYFAVGTEILDDSGCPHTLEHLVFMGSKKYPYKGLLDLLGNMAFSVTNAWTATDQTVYTLTTAGWDGFRMLLPVYLDHILYPKITDAACYTEVYHLDGEAKDKGVVYSEMQAIENQPSFIQGLTAQRTLYKKSGYKSETGGLTKNLRILKNDEIRKYHSENYRPDNLCIIISGPVDEGELLDVMTRVDSELDSLPAVPRKRPFLDSPHDEPLTTLVKKTVEFPDEDESSSEVQFSWIGPDGRDLVMDQAVDILCKYFTSTAVSLFSQHFIEVDEPLATSSDFYSDSFLKTGINIQFSNVPTNEADTFPEKVLKLMNDHCDSKKLDFKRLRDLVEQSRRKYLFSSEKSPDSAINMAIFEALYGNADGSSLEQWLKDLHEYDKLLTWSVDKWAQTYKKYFLNNKPCIVVAKPSAKLYSKLKQENEKLIGDRRAKLGKNGLKDLERKLQEAEAENEKPVPKKIIDKFGQPNPSKIEFIKTTPIAAGLNKDLVNDSSSSVVQDILGDQPANFPLYVHMENIESNFAIINILFSSEVIDKKYLPYSNILRNLLSFPLRNDDGTLTPYDELIKQINQDMLGCVFSSSFQGSFAELFSLKMTIPAENYVKAIDWCYKLLFKTEFDKKRILITLRNAINRLPEVKRSGTVMLGSLMNKVLFTDRSLRKANDVYQNQQFFRDLLKQIETDEGFEKLVSILEKVRSQMFDLANMRVFVVLDHTKIEHPLSSWESFIKKVEEKKGLPGKLVPLPLTSNVLSLDGLNKEKKCFIVTTPGSDSSYMYLQTKVPFEYDSKDAFKIILGAEFFQCVEGPFWKAIRGTGLAYGANMYKNFETGQLTFSIYRGVDTQKCYEAARKVVSDYSNGALAINDEMKRAAVSSVVNMLTNGQSNYFEAATAEFFNINLSRRGQDYSKRLMNEISSISTDDLLYIFNKYFIPVFDPSRSICFISCNPAQEESTTKYFKNIGYKVFVEHVSPSDEDNVDVTEESKL
ncbi:hypothetical protein BRETT_000688 [Brettanomyces bruxellensis]|uniref:Mitochondrial presequence protease n=1 Tax=Dekkera bruxellensis TaxID=5007 RepID=A0A871RD56_DEKBR|nr:uncharacterized protein BRETT_000688 [Brettanomyces bruxellensis]QOU20972.1 hypothetical protein BRETT_000688 [Brettanomyces bruxellensis]